MNPTHLEDVAAFVRDARAGRSARWPILLGLIGVWAASLLRVSWSVRIWGTGALCASLLLMRPLFVASYRYASRKALRRWPDAVAAWAAYIDKRSTSSGKAAFGHLVLLDGHMHFFCKRRPDANLHVPLRAVEQTVHVSEVDTTFFRSDVLDVLTTDGASLTFWVMEPFAEPGDAFQAAGVP
ncbi:MAG: hypothetical protein M3O70_27280, partial [Actinomycetota bacterium]|nr:hypothetical protein [Actinomycetota bacterium]